MKINTDKASEEYRKYIIELLTSDHNKIYLLWGTDKSNEDFDYVFLNEENRMNAFFKIETLKRYLRSKEIPVDSVNTKKWAEEHDSNEPYSIYDLSKLIRILKPNFNLNKISRTAAFDLLHFYNLFSDLAYQTNESILLKIIKGKNIKVFFDFTYNTFFWNSTGLEKEIREAAQSFNNLSFVNNYLKMIKVFEKRIAIADDSVF